MNLEGILLSKISQTEEDKYCMLSLICGPPPQKKESRIRDRTHECLAEGWGVGTIGVGDEEL